MNELNDIGESLEASLAKDTLFDIMSALGDSTIEMLLEIGGSIPFFPFLTLLRGKSSQCSTRFHIFREGY